MTWRTDGLLAGPPGLTRRQSDRATAQRRRFIQAMRTTPTAYRMHEGPAVPKRTPPPGPYSSSAGAGSTERAARLLHQVGLDERVEVAVEDAVDVAHFHLGAVVLDHLVRLQHVAADLAAEGDVLLLAADLVEPGLPAPSASSRRAASVRTFIADARFLCCERSFWHDTTMPVGKCVMRTAESVTLTCCPPAPLER